MREIDRFLGSVLDEEAEFDRVLATVMFTDIVGSTQRASQIGDRAWRQLLATHHQRVRGLLARYRGREVDTAGDGFLATFDGPARAIRCAKAIAQAMQDLGIEVRVGLHTGEIELEGDAVRGIAVHIGARVASMAGPGQVLVSNTVKDLVAGLWTHVRGPRGARAEGCPRPLAPLRRGVRLGPGQGRSGDTTARLAPRGVVPRRVHGVPSRRDRAPAAAAGGRAPRVARRHGPPAPGSAGLPRLRSTHEER